jgi:hypothetical protein
VGEEAAQPSSFSLSTVLDACLTVLNALLALDSLGGISHELLVLLPSASQPIASLKTLCRRSGRLVGAWSDFRSLYLLAGAIGGRVSSDGWNSHVVAWVVQSLLVKVVALLLGCVDLWLASYLVLFNRRQVDLSREVLDVLRDGTRTVWDCACGLT